MGKADKYMAIGLGGAIVIVASIFPLMVYMSGKEHIAAIELEKAKVEKGYILYERDLNEDGIPESFYEINRRKVFLSVDGRCLESMLKDQIFLSKEQDPNNINTEN